jgi:hypothetical protein
MFLIVIIAIEFIIFQYIARHLSIQVWLLVCAIYGIVNFWLDDGPWTGHRSWNRFRALGIWKRILPLKIEYTGSRDKLAECREPLIFVLVNCQTHWPLLYGFGLCPPVAMCSVLLPRILFLVPLLKDVLLWIGGVSQDGDAIRQLLLLKRSVACGFPTQLPPAEIFTLARELNVQVVPVYVSGERARYAWLPSAGRLTEYCKGRWNWPFPVWTMPRIWGRHAPVLVHACIGTPMNSHVFDTNDAFQEYFTGQIEAMKNLID